MINNNDKMINQDETELSLTLSKSEYPDLSETTEGQIIKGDFEGSVGMIDKNNVQVIITNLNLETENQADKSLKKMINNGNEVKSNNVIEEE